MIGGERKGDVLIRLGLNSRSLCTASIQARTNAPPSPLTSHEVLVSLSSTVFRCILRRTHLFLRVCFVRTLYALCVNICKSYAYVIH